MSRTHRFLKGLALGYGFQALVVLVGIWLTPFYLHRIGQHDYGLWLLGSQLLLYLTLTDFGVVALLPQETAYATGRAGGDDASASELPFVVGQTARLVLYQLPLVAALAATLWFTIPPNWHDLRGPLAIVMLGFVLAFPLRILPALLQGLQDLAFANSIQILNWTITTAATVSMVLAGWSLYALAWGWFASQFIMLPVYVYRLRSRFPQVLPRSIPSGSWNITRTRLGKGFWVSIAQIAQMLVSNTDLLIVGKVLGPSAVVPYACTAKLAAILGNQTQILMQTAEPALCELRTGESRERMFHVLVALTHGILTFSGLVFCVVLLVNQWFVGWWVTAQQYGGTALTVVILTNIVVRHWTMLTGYSVFCFGYMRRISLTNLIDGLVTAASCYIMIKLIGLIGAPIGSIIGAVLVSLPANLRRIARDTHVTLPRLVNSMLSSWAWRFLLVVGAVSLVRLHWTPKSLLESAAACVAVAAVYSLVMLPNLLRPPLGVYIRSLGSSFRARYVALQARFS